MRKKKKLEKDKQMKPKASRRKNLIKLTEEMSKLENRRKKIEKINATKRWLFENINKIDRPLVRLTKEKECKLLNQE